MRCILSACTGVRGRWVWSTALLHGVLMLMPMIEEEAALLEEEAAKFGATNLTTGPAQDHYAFPGPQAIALPHNNYHPPPAVCGVPNLALPVLPAFYVPPLGPVEMFKFTSTPMCDVPWAVRPTLLAARAVQRLREGHPKAMVDRWFWQEMSQAIGLP
ncbi:unnamed protein product [Vitrella brassicaformis CCMP3155]|uniref:Uncharacterized protein n=1 Tax=Vitrella brassicaformis (strain CCMP3155) TaxID=1169540 RepID=A0A0G4EY17_VITBC|nr:unnamed protein product [Vitrella brassicaformis CCMP3155]|eukprot:CEM03315.1 unnamed protein product [Vitrella brassicaformis CCMP3155]